MKNLIFILFLTIPFLVVYPQDTINVPGDYTTIQAAIDAAVNGDIVLVAEDTYYENINFKGKAITVASHFLLDGNESHIENTIINGSQPLHSDSGSVVYFISAEDTTSVLCGFTITGGTGTYLFFDGANRNIGGGICAVNSSVTIKNNIVEFNVLDHPGDVLIDGGGICALSEDSSNYIIENNVIRNNFINSVSTTYVCQGGGILTLTYGKVWIINNKICDNTVTGRWAYDGGIAFGHYGSGLNYWIVSNLISGNNVNGTIEGGGGGISIYQTPAIFKNNLLANNSAQKGGAMWIETATATNLENNTIINNTATSYGGGLYIIGAVPQLMNFIIWGNTAPSGPQISGNADVQYSDVEGGQSGTGNINLDPQFIPGSDFYLLAATSPCIDSGNPGLQYNDVEDPTVPGSPLWPAQGTLRNDMGHLGGPGSLWYHSWPLPVELTSFTATTQFGKVILNWSTATEINNLGFEIERKIINAENNGEWMLVGFREGCGTTTEPKEYSYVDDINGISATSLAYRLKQIDFLGSYEYSDEVLITNPAPIDFALHQNYPNPFNPTTTIVFGVPIKSQVSLKIFNSIGEQVAQLINEEKPEGRYEVEFNATQLPSGVYFYSLQVGSFTETKKMVLLK